MDIESGYSEDTENTGTNKIESNSKLSSLHPEDHLRDTTDQISITSSRDSVLVGDKQQQLSSRQGSLNTDKKFSKSKEKIRIRPGSTREDIQLTIRKLNTESSSHEGCDVERILYARLYSVNNLGGISVKIANELVSAPEGVDSWLWVCAITCIYENPTF